MAFMYRNLHRLPERATSSSTRVTHFDEFDPIPERIGYVHTLQARQRHGSLHGVAGVHTTNDECRESFDPQRWVGFTSRPEVGFNAEVQLHASASEPRAPAPGEGGGLGYLLKAEHVAIEPAGRILPACRHGELHVVYGDNAHGETTITSRTRSRRAGFRHHLKQDCRGD
jgi:hypothetical protein